jgi:hypothetical protein
LPSIARHTVCGPADGFKREAMLARSKESLPVAAAEAEALGSGFGGRSDIVIFDADRKARDQILRLRTTEDLFVEVGRTPRSEGVAGLRLTGAQMRQHGGREAERHGAPAHGCRHNGDARPRARRTPARPVLPIRTILARRHRRAGRAGRGLDIDHAAVQTTGYNVPGAAVREGDARHLDLPDGSVGACVSNLPFGHQHGVQGSMKDWLAAVPGEMTRVTRPGGRIILLAPEIPRGEAHAPPAQVLGRHGHLAVLDHDPGGSVWR